MLDVPVKVNGAFREKTDRNGEWLVPNVNPYYPSRVEIDADVIPMTYYYERVRATVAPGYGQGTVVTFPAKRGNNHELLHEQKTHLSNTL